MNLHKIAIVDAEYLKPEQEFLRPVKEKLVELDLGKLDLKESL